MLVHHLKGHLYPINKSVSIMEAYCVKCKAKREMKNAAETSMKKKGGGTRPAMKGECPTCGTKMFRIMAMKK